MILWALLVAIPTLISADQTQTRKEVYGGYLPPQDHYHYDLHGVRAGDHFRISLSNVSGNLDPFLRVSLGGFNLEDDDSGLGSDAVVQFVAPQNGTYDIEIFPYQDTTFGEYALTIERSSSTASTTGPLATLNIGRSHPSLAVQELHGSLENPGDIYEHELAHLKAGHTLYVFVESLTPGLELEVQIKDFQRKILSDVLPNSETHITTVAFPIVETGDHYDLVIKATDGKSSGDYRALLGLDAPEILEGKSPMMPTYASLGEADYGAIIDYMKQSLGAVSASTPESEKRRSVQYGKRLYEDHCADCHTISRQGFTVHGADWLLSTADAAIRNAIADAWHFGDPIIREPREIRVGFELQQLTEIDQRSERFGVVGTFRAEWTDHNLAFDASDHETKKLTYADRQLVSFLEQNKIDWPDFRIVNQQTKSTQYRVLNIYSGGHVFYEERFHATLQAPEFDFRKFPFDHQDFWLRIETQEPDTFATLALHENPDFNRIGKQLGEEEWLILESVPVVTDVEGHYRYSLDIRAKRHTTYYLFRILAPMALIVLIGWGIFFIFDHNTQSAAASGNLLVFIAFNFTVGDSLPRLGYLTFLDSIMFAGFVASISSLLLALYLKRLETVGHAEYAKTLERRALIIMPPAFALVVALLVVYFFEII